MTNLNRRIGKILPLITASLQFDDALNDEFTVGVSGIFQMFVIMPIYMLYLYTSRCKVESLLSIWLFL